MLVLSNTPCSKIPIPEPPVPAQSQSWGKPSSVCEPQTPAAGPEASVILTHELNTWKSEFDSKLKEY